MDTGQKGLRCEVVAVLVDRLGHSPDRVAVRALLAQLQRRVRPDRETRERHSPHQL